MKGYLSKEPDFEVVGEYADGESTWAGIKALRPQVALLDIRMPGLDGITIARMARDAGIQTAALMLTSYDANQYVLAALRAGARGYLLKTATMDTPATTSCRSRSPCASARCFCSRRAASRARR